MANRQRGAIAADDTYANLLLGGGEGTMFDPRGNYTPYLEDLQREGSQRSATLLGRNRLAGMLNPNIDPSQRAYAGMLGEANAFGGVQESMAGARRQMAERNQAYQMDMLNQMYRTQSGADAASDLAIAQAKNRPKDNWYDPFVQIAGAGVGKAVDNWTS
jgi:hypothetical protein